MDEKKRILIVDDDPDIAEAMKVMLEAQDYEVSLSGDPEDGMKKALAQEPAVIILDVMFGTNQRTEGFDCALKMKQNQDLAKIPILMVTAVNMEQPGFGFSPKTDGEFLPVDDFIDKPAQAQQLIEKVNRLVAMKVSKWEKWPNPSE